MTRVTAALLLVLFTCSSPVDPNQGLFACENGDQCGNKYVCKPQFVGGGRCYPVDTCQALDVCNGMDDDCDGVVDNFVPQDGKPCESALKGVCQTGKFSCVSAALTCIQTVQPTAEKCNGLDDDCDGQVDEDFMLSSDPLNCGVCDRQCAVQTGCVSGACVEVKCADGLDNDNNGKTDCDDPACLGNVCFSTDYRCVAADGGVDGGAAAVDAGVLVPDGGPGLNCVAP